MEAPKKCVECHLGYVMSNCEASEKNPARTAINDAYKIPGSECPFMQLDRLRKQIRACSEELRQCLTPLPTETPDTGEQEVRGDVIWIRDGVIYGEEPTLPADKFMRVLTTKPGEQQTERETPFLDKYPTLRPIVTPPWMQTETDKDHCPNCGTKLLTIQSEGQTYCPACGYYREPDGKEHQSEKGDTDTPDQQQEEQP